MPKRTDIKKYPDSGRGARLLSVRRVSLTTPARRPVKPCVKRGYRVILVNSNPATIMTDPEMADATYIEPIHWEVVRKIIEKERPDAVRCRPWAARPR